MSGQNKPAAAPPAGPPEGPHPELDTRSIPPVEPIPSAKKEGGAAVAAAAGRVERMRKPLTAQERFSRMLTQYVGGTGSLRNQISEKGLKDYFGVEIKFSLDKKGMEEAVAAVRKKQVELNIKLKADKQPPILVDGILGPQTFGAIKKIEGDVAIALLKEGKKEENAVAATPAPVPAEKAGSEAEKPKPLEIRTEAPPAPSKEPVLPIFHADKFYEVNDDLNPRELEKNDLKVGEVLYATGQDGNIIILQKSDPHAAPVRMHPDHLVHLDRDDAEKRHAFLADRYEKLPKPSYIISLGIKPENIRLLDGSRICILGNAGVGIVRVLRANGEQEVVKSEDLDDADNEEKNSYLVEVYQTLQERHRQILAKWDTVETQRQRALLDLFLANKANPESNLTAQLERELGAGRKKFKDATAEATLSGTTYLNFISPKTGRLHTLNITVRQGTNVAVLSKTPDNKYYQVVSPNGFEGYIAVNSVQKNTLVARQIPATAPAAGTAAAPSPAPPTSPKG